MSSDGRPLGGAIVVLRTPGSGIAGEVNVGGGNQVRPDGTFRLINVPPGEYVLDVQQRPQNIQNLQNLNIGSSNSPRCRSAWPATSTASRSSPPRA